MRYRTHRDAEHAVGRRCDPSGLQLLARAREIQQRRRIVVSRADDEGDLIFLLKVVEFFGQLGKLVERAYFACAERQIPDLVFVGVLLQRFVERLKELGLKQGQRASLSPDRRSE